MGMYTEFVFKADIKSSATSDAIAVLEVLFGGGDLINGMKIPDHDFFDCPRWQMVGNCSSHYHHPEVVNSFTSYDYTSSRSVFSRSDLKNYHGEIEKFLDWVDEYIDVVPGKCIGWSWYEENEEPTLIYKK